MTLLRSAATVGGMTLISRMLGFIRDMLFAAILGTGPVADAFVVAFRFPNLFRRLFAEGAFNAAFVPLFAKRVAGEGRASARRFGEEALSALLAALVAITAAAEIAMPWLIHVIAPGFADTPDKLDLARMLTAIAFPYLLFVSLVALYSGILNSAGRFAAAAAAPIVLNIVLIGVLCVAAIAFPQDRVLTGTMLAWGVSAAGLLQLLMLIRAARREGYALGLRRPRMTPGVRRLVALGIPGVVAGGITQVNLLIGTIIASFQDSGVSYLYFADRIYQLPLGVVGIAIGIALLPELSRRLRAGDRDGADESQNRALEFAMLLTVPAAAALAAMPLPVIHVLFERGAFTPADTMQTGAALAAFAAGLPAFVLIKVFSPGFFAREDTRTPMLFAGAGVAVNIAGSLALFPFFGHTGIALATSAAAWINAGLLARALAKRGRFLLDGRNRRRLPLIVLSGAVMGATLWAAQLRLAPWFSAGAALEMRILVLAGMAAGGAAVFFAAAALTGAASARELTGLFRKRPE